MTRRRGAAGRLGTWLRRPGVVVGEIGGVAAAGIALSVIPQAGEASWLRLREDHPAALALLRALSLDRVLTSWWFLPLLGAAGASLGLAAVDQWRRAWRQAREPLAEASFSAARFRRAFERPARSPGGGRRVELRAKGRLGPFGSPVFHTGVLLAVAAGVLRALLAVDAVALVVEGQELPAGQGGYLAQRPGWMARPFALDQPLRLERVEPRRYPSGALEQLTVELSVGGARRRVSVNDALDVPGGRLWLSQEHGPAAAIELGRAGGLERMGIILRQADGVFEGRAVAPGGTEVRLSAPDRGEPGPPKVLRARVLRRGALLFIGDLAAGQGVEWGSGERLGLLGVATWVELRGTRDPSVWLLALGAAVAVLGIALSFAVVRVDTAVIVEPAGPGERVQVALRAHRFAPLFAERFEELVRREGGPPG